MILRTIDAHTAGEPLRLIVGGFPAVEGRTMLERREWIRDRCDHVRRALMLEPRGHVDMYGALLTEPEHPGSDVGVLFMHNAGYSTMCGHGVIAVVTIALERGLIGLKGQEVRQKPDAAAGESSETVEMVLDSPAGPIRARAAVLTPERSGSSRTSRPVASGFSPTSIRVASVRFENVPSFVLHGGVPIRLGGRELRADVAFGGAFYAIVDSEAAGIPVDPARLSDLRRAGMEIKQAVEKIVRVSHPDEPLLNGIYGTIFTGPATSTDADLRNVTIFADAEVDRSPCGTGTCAVMAVLSEMGMLGPEQTFTHESIIGTRFHGRVVKEVAVGELRAIVPEIEGDAYITGEHTFIVDERDPLGFGFRL